MIRRLPVGAEPGPGGVHFRVWAPIRQRVEVVLERDAVPLQAEANGYFSGLVHQATVGSRYRFRLGGGESFPDPASRFQPEGPFGPSEVVDPGAFAWRDADWRGAGLPGQVIYELHIGAFTPEGTWQSARRELPELAACGVTCLEVMPVAEFPGRFGWGYDGVFPFAPTRLYGSPDDFRRFVEAAHRLGLAVILDVVYNHLGPAGNCLACFAPAYFTKRYRTAWGEALNFAGPDAGPVREYFLANAGYWIDEYHLDGLRLDATQCIHDDAVEPGRHILAEVGERVRRAAGRRATLVIGETEARQARLACPMAEGGAGLDALWNDDFHHAAAVALTGRREGYFARYRGQVQELLAAARSGFLFPEQRAFDLPPAAFVTYLDNHDQVANAERGLRLHARSRPGRYRALLALLLLGPGTPMLFMGQEFAASAPFLYFADHEPDLAESVLRGRQQYLAQFPGRASDVGLPHEFSTFERCKLDLTERQRHAEMYRLTRELLRLRRETPAFQAQRAGDVAGAVLGEEAFALRFFAAAGDRLLLVNLGAELALSGDPEPLLAPPTGQRWRVELSTGPRPETFRGEFAGRAPGESAVVLGPLSS